MGADSCFRIGSTHAVCQDYACSGRRDGVEFAIVSDGCSGISDPEQPAAPYTDFGSRFLALSATRHVDRLADGWFAGEQIAAEADAITRLSGLPESTLDATLLTVAWRRGHTAHIFVAGDGVVATRWRDGRTTYSAVSYSKNAPQYLSYLLSRGRARTFYDAQQSRRWECDAGIFEAPVDQSHIVDHYCSDPKSALATVVITDGSESFTDANNNPVPLKDVVGHLLDFKGFAGSFVARRCNGFLKRFCAQNEWSHADDLAVAGIHFGDDP